MADVFQGRLGGGPVDRNKVTALAAGWITATLLAALVGGACTEEPESTPPVVADGGSDVSGAVTCAWDVQAPS